MLQLQKRIAEGEAKMKQQQNLYEAVRSDRNIYSKSLIESQVGGRGGGGGVGRVGKGKIRGAGEDGVGWGALRRRLFGRNDKGWGNESREDERGGEGGVSIRGGGGQEEKVLELGLDGGAQTGARAWVHGVWA